MKTLTNEKTEQVNFLDERFYTNDGINFFPSSTHILDLWPKGYGYIQWLKDLGSNAEQVLQRAADKGSKIHRATEDLNNGLEIFWDDKLYSKDEWEMINRYVEFWNTVKPKLLANELKMCSPTLGYGGCIDRALEMFDTRFICDIKTGNAIYKSHELQQASYAKLWNEKFPMTQIDATCIINLNAKTRTKKVDFEKRIIQGVGWQVVFYDRHYNDSFKLFQHIHEIWKEENPNPKPLNLVYPMKVKL